MNSREIFGALKSGKITREDAKKELMKQITVEQETSWASDSSGFLEMQTSRRFWDYGKPEGFHRINQPSGIQPTGENRQNTKSIVDGRVYPSGKRQNTVEAGKDNEAIAIVGMSGRFPGAGNLDKYWENLAGGIDSVREIPKSRWDMNEYFDPRPNQKGKMYCKWLGILDDIEFFDPLFFNISPAEGEVMDPQHRLFLQEGYKAFEDAGYNCQLLNNRKCGVYLGIMSNEYSLMLSLNRVEGDLTGNSNAIAAARLPYYLNLKGPAISIDTACSSSLVALHLACQALQNHEIDMALVGGVSLYLTPGSYIGMCTARMLSADGRCKTFDNSANGFVPGEGVGALVLKRLKEAELDHDHIYGVIIGSGINQDGKTNGISAPSVNSQIELEREIYAKNKIDPESIRYVEMHGTGTKLGDPIELEALATVFKEKTKQKNYCAIGSVKSNIGHTSAAAGVASVQKVLLCLDHKQLAPTLNFKTPNEHFNFLESPFYVNTELQPWEGAPGKPRRASVSSFGFSGTNAHIVIEEYLPKTVAVRESLSSNFNHQVLFILSTKIEDQLKIYAKEMKRYIEFQANLNLVDLAYTLQVGREAMDYRLAFLADSKEAVLKGLEGFINHNSAPGVLTAQVKKGKDGVMVFETDEEAKSLLHKWFQSRKLQKIAELWVRGLNIDWNQLYDESKPYRISLPTYPFVKERYWAPVETYGRMSQQAGEGKPVISEITKPPKTEKAILIKDWQPKELQTEPDGLTGVIIILGTVKTIKLALSLFQDTETVKTKLVIHGETDITSGIATDFYSSSAGEELYRKIKANLKEAKLTGVIDLTAYDDEYEQSAALEAGKLTFLQKLIAKERQQGYCLMQVTYRLNNLEITKTTMQGARLTGLYRMLGTEYQQIKTLTMDTDCPLNFYKKSAKQIQTEFSNRERENYCQCCYRNDIRYEPILKISRTEAEIQAESRIPARYQAEEVVLITGGTRGIGAAIAGDIVSRGVRNLIIMGREELPEQSEWETVIAKQEQPELTEKLKRLQSYIERGVKVRYDHTSLSDATGLREMVGKVHQEFGPITGVFHCAGLASKTPIFFEKPLSEIAAVYEPKTSGLVSLHRALAEEPLSFFILFSSISGIAPTLAVGQSDYAAANAYMDYYAMNQAGQGNTYLKSVQWPAWGETGMAAGGMRTPAYLNTGLASHSTADGLMLLDVIKQGSYTVSAPCVMIPAQFIPNQLLQIKLAPPAKEAGFKTRQASLLKPAGPARDLHSKIGLWLRDIFMGQLKLSNDQWDRSKTFGEYGVDSIILAQSVMIMQERVAKPLDPSLLLQYRTVDELAEYFALHHGEAFGATDQSENGTATGLDAETVDEKASDKFDGLARTGTGPEYPEIAIIGIACRFPDSPDKEAYWELLNRGMSAIKPAPEERWGTGGNRRHYGGWIEALDLFDAKFFNINEKDAAAMDPQARVILEESLKAIYDAGYDHQQLSGLKIGVYIGGRSPGGMDPAAILQAPNPVLGVGQNYLATNISRFFNFTGASMVVDTACSSGLTGMSLAAEALQGRRIDMALAGAVNLLNPGAFEFFAARNILSKNGEFHIFEEQSGGEVLGEGAGVVILKRLNDAIRDGNRIYGVIKAIAVNNDGRTIGPGSPNPDAQKQVIKEALALSGKSIEEIGYIEVNGGGTPVVDAVEIKSLAVAYNLDNRNLAPCYLGSVKPNIGHLLLTSGMAELIRCVLSVYHKRIPPFLSAREPFPYYDFGNSRIRFNRETIDWEVPAGRKRVAALNSFPDGGTNCHLIIEEFTPDFLSYQPFFMPKELPALARKDLYPDGPPKPNTEKTKVFITKWGEYIEFKK